MPETDAPSGWRDAGHYGAAGTRLTLAEAVITCAWNVQGDGRSVAFADEARRCFGIALPASPNSVARTDAVTALWLGPASWLLFSRGAARLDAFDTKREALGSAGGALFDVSASRVAWTVAGAEARSVLAKSCPLDLHPRVFAPGTCAQSLFGHVNALLVNDGEAFTLLVARSFARDVWHALCTSAAPYGCTVLVPAPYS